MTAHTPGPWRWCGHAVRAAISDVYIARLYKWQPDYPDRPRSQMEEDANARLVAAAPELLAALQRAVETIRAFHGIGLSGKRDQLAWDLYQQSPEMKAINAAIAKAEGTA